MTPVPELHRPLAVDAVPPSGQDVEVEASPAECALLAQRMRLPELRSLRCRFRLSPGLGGAVAAEGWLCAEVVQTCVVSLEEFAATLAEQFAVRFVPSGAEGEELDFGAVDEIPYTGGVIDLGEAAAEQLALALDPYPRAPGAALPDVAKPQDDAASPFARLALRRTQ